MKNFQKQKIITVIILLTVVIVLIYIKRENRSTQLSYRKEKLPKFEAEDIKGRKIKSSLFNEKNLYLQFINSRFLPDLYLFEKVCTKWVNEDLFFLGIISDTNALKKLKSEFQTENVTFIEGSYNVLCKKFNVDVNDGLYFLVDKNGIVINSGKNDLGYEKGPKVFLQELLKGDCFSLSELLQENRNIGDFSWFSQVDDLIKNRTNKKYFIISLFTKICESCSGGKIIRSISKIDGIGNGSVYSLFILPRKYDNEAIINLKSQLKISFPVIIANNELNSKWNSLIKRYREDFLNANLN